MHEPTKNEKRNGNFSSFPCINISASNSDLFQSPISFDYFYRYSVVSN